LLTYIVHVLDKYSTILHNARYTHQDYLQGVQLKTEPSRKSTNRPNILSFKDLLLFKFSLRLRAPMNHTGPPIRGISGGPI